MKDFNHYLECISQGYDEVEFLRCKCGAEFNHYETMLYDFNMHQVEEINKIRNKKEVDNE